MILWQLFITFLKVGTFTFGGGLAMLPVIKREVVEERHWLTEEEIVDCFAVAQSLPGMMSLNAAIYIGKKTAGIAGTVVAATATVFPAFVSIIVILLFLAQIENNPFVLGAFDGIKAASVGLILVTAWKMGKNMLTGVMQILVAAVSFLMIVVAGYSAVIAIIFGGVAGYIAYILKKIKDNKERIKHKSVENIENSEDEGGGIK